MAGMTPNLKASATIEARRFVTVSGNFTAATCGANGIAIGISQPYSRRFDSDDAAQSGEAVPLIGVGEYGEVEAGGAITAGTRIVSDANGKAVAMAAAVKQNVAGIALETAAGAGEFIRVFVVREQVDNS